MEKEVSLQGVHEEEGFLVQSQWMVQVVEVLVLESVMGKLMVEYAGVWIPLGMLEFRVPRVRYCGVLAALAIEMAPAPRKSVLMRCILDGLAMKD